MLSYDEEQQLVREAKASLQAFSKLYQYYLPRIYAYTLNRTGDPKVAEDLTSETFFKAMKGLNSFQMREYRFGSWLYKIAHNTIIQIVGKIISTIFGLLAVGMMTRYLGTEKFGWYVTAITFLQFVGILIDFGLIPVTAQMLSEPTDDKEKLLKNLLGFRLTTALIFLGVAPFIAMFLPYPLEVKIAIGFR